MIAFVRSIDVPFSPVDLQTRAIDLAYGLGSLRHFLEAARELLTCNRLPHSDFKRHNKKVRHLTHPVAGFSPPDNGAAHTQIITLIEVH